MLSKVNEKEFAICGLTGTTLLTVHRLSHATLFSDFFTMNDVKAVDKADKIVHIDSPFFMGGDISYRTQSAKMYNIKGKSAALTHLHSTSQDENIDVNLETLTIVLRQRDELCNMIKKHGATVEAKRQMHTFEQKTLKFQNKVGVMLSSRLWEQQVQQRQWVALWNRPF